MHARRAVWRVMLAVAAGLTCTLAALGWWALGDAEGAMRLRVGVALGALWLLGVLALGVLAAWLDRSLLRPLAVLTRGTRILTGAHAGHRFEIAPGHLLGELADAIQEAGDSLHQARGEVARALARGGEAAEAQKSRLAAVLRELTEGVVVCDARARILLYNRAAQAALGSDPGPGLGRPLFRLVDAAPIEHARSMLVDGGGSDARFLCHATGSGAALRGRLSLLPEETAIEGGFVVTFEDQTRRVQTLRRRDALLRRLLADLRSPLASLSAALDALAACAPDDAGHRAGFERVVRADAAKLTARLQRAAHEKQLLVGAGWLMRDVDSTALAAAVAVRVRGEGLRCAHAGAPLWLVGDDHALALVLARLAHGIAHVQRVAEFEVEALIGDRRVYLDLVWAGEPLAAGQIDAWLAETLPEAGPGITGRDVLDSHSAEIWSQLHRGDGRALLRVPLPASDRQWAPPRAALPARPEFYDFAIAEQGRAALDADGLAARPLAEIEYVIFDTGTRGPRPSSGDRGGSRAGVGGVHRRVLRDETFSGLVNPGRPVPASSTRFHGITDADVADAPPAAQVLAQFNAFIGDAVLIAHNSAFDMKFLRMGERDSGVRFDNVVLDTLLLSVFRHGHLDDHTLDGIAARLGVDISDRHTALGDARVTAEVWLALLPLLEQRGVHTLAAAIAAADSVVEVRRLQEQF